MKPRSNKVVAAFDFDGTITDTDSLRVFLHYSLGNIKFARALIKAAPQLYACHKGNIDRQAAKEALMTASFGGKSIYEVHSWVTAFVKSKLPYLLRPRAVARIAWHQEQGHEVIIVSASPGLYIKPWARMMGIHTVIASELEEVDKFYTGRLSTKNCWGPEKVERLRSWWQQDKPEFLYAYGDSIGDMDMLQISDEPWFQGARITHRDLLYL